MKSCAEYEPLISAFLDGELSEEERMEVAAHLAECPACQKYFDDLVAIHDALDQTEAPVPEGFSGRVMAQVRETPQEPAGKVIRVPHWGRWAALAACCTVVAVGAWSVRELGTRTASQTATSSSAEIVSHDEEPCDAGGEPEALMDDAAVFPEAAPAAADSAGSGNMSRKSISEDAGDTDAFYVEDMEAPMEAALPAPALAAENVARGTITAGGPAARAWIEETLGLEWEPGRVYPLTEEEYVGLLEALNAAGEDFQTEESDGWQLLAA